MDNEKRQHDIDLATKIHHQVAAKRVSHSNMSTTPTPTDVDVADRPLDMAAINRGMTFHPSDAYVISVGTVTMDFKKGKILVIFNRKRRIYQLPKGRRNIGEDFLEGALRETYEETGFRVQPLSLKVSTRATLSDELRQDTSTKSPQVTYGVDNNEFIGAVNLEDPQSDAPAIKSMFYYAAHGDSTATRDRETSEAYEKLVAHWLPIPEIPEKLEFTAEIETVQKALRDAVNSGHQIETLDHWQPESE